MHRSGSPLAQGPFGVIVEAWRWHTHRDLRIPLAVDRKVVAVVGAFGYALDGRAPVASIRGQELLCKY